MIAPPFSSRLPLTQMIGFGPLYLPRQEIEARLVRRWGADWVELAPKDTTCAALFISKRAWRKSGQPLPQPLPSTR